MLQVGDSSETYYSEDSRHRPMWVTDADYHIESGSSFTSVTPRKGEEFSVVELPIDTGYFDGSDASFCAISAVHPSGITYFGWIDGYSPVAVGKSTRIKWHVDWWTTTQFNESLRTACILGEGRFKRIADSEKARPDSSVPVRWEIDLTGEISAYQAEKGPWIIVVNTDKTDIGETVIRYKFWYEGMSWKDSQSGQTMPSVSISEIYNGYLEEHLGLDADSVLGVYFSPIPPAASWTVKTSNGHAYYCVGQNETIPTIENGVIVPCIESLMAQQDKMPVRTDDHHKWVVQDPYGVVYYTLPWGFSVYYFPTGVTGLRAKVDVGTNGAYLILNFSETSSWNPADGQTVQIPLISAPVTSNAMSSYVLSGQRDYDIATAQLQAEQSRKSGWTNVGTGAIGGGLVGAMTSNPYFAVAGAAIGAVASIVGTEVNYAVTKEYDQKSQAETDKLMSNQTASALISAGGWGWKGQKWMLCRMSRDAESEASLSAEQEEMGYLTDRYFASCAEEIGKGGPMRIEGLRVSGVPRQGCEYISAIFNQGVNLDKLEDEE